MKHARLVKRMALLRLVHQVDVTHATKFHQRRHFLWRERLLLLILCCLQYVLGVNETGVVLVKNLPRK